MSSKTTSRLFLFGAMFTTFVLGICISACTNDELKEDIQFGPESTSSSSSDDSDSSSSSSSSDSFDTDNDGLSTAVEDNIGSDPEDFDTDNDGFGDGLEFVGLNSDPLNASFTPSSYNSSKILDSENIVRNELDTDHDGLGDTYETSVGLDPSNADSDGDGYKDGIELVGGSDPNDASSVPQRTSAPTTGVIDVVDTTDSDGDGLSADTETLYETDSTKRDTDGDGYSDGIEVLMGSEPTDEASVPKFNYPKSN